MKPEHKRFEGDDFTELKNLWLRVFDENEEALELFFKRNKTSFVPYCSTCNGKIISALYLLPCTLNGENAHYLCGAATAPEYRRRGIMSDLISFALDDAKNRGDAFSLLFPANQSESLYRFYGRLGYAPGCTAAIRKMTRAELAALAKNCGGEPDFESLQGQCFNNNFLLWNNDYIKFAEAYYRVYNASSVSCKAAFAIFEESGGAAEVFYSAYSDFGCLCRLLLDNSKAKSFVFTLKADSPLLTHEKPERYGMIKALDKSKKIPNNIYLGITLN